MTVEDFGQQHGYRPPTSPKKHSQARKRFFTPSAPQIAVAKKRIVAAVTRKNFTVLIESFGDAVAFCTKHVHNRGRQLGDHKNGEFTTVVTVALEQLVREEVLEIDIGLGTLKLIKKPAHPKRTYAKRRPAYRAA